MGIWSVISIYISALAIWMGARCFKGQGTFTQTRAAVIWTLICKIPIGFFCLLLYFTMRLPNLGQIAFILGMASLLGIVVTTIYSFIVLLKTVSETHGFGFGRAFFSIVIALFMLSVVAYGILAVF